MIEGAVSTQMAARETIHLAKGSRISVLRSTLLNIIAGANSGATTIKNKGTAKGRAFITFWSELQRCRGCNCGAPVVSCAVVAGAVDESLDMAVSSELRYFGALM